MKKRITIEQFKELTDEQRRRLREWWKPELGDAFAYEWHDEILSDVLVKSRDTETVLDDAIILLSIGQMIEFLDDERQSVVPVPLGQIMPNYHLLYTDSLCDSLWSAVKQTL